MNIGIYIYRDAEVLDFAGPFEVFSTASRLCDKSDPFFVFFVAESDSTVSARGGLRITPDYSINYHPPIDILIIPGGVHGPEMENIKVASWIRGQATTAKMVATVCTGIFLLANAIPYLGCKVTTHWEDIHELRHLFGRLQVVEGVRWIDEGRVISSAGISAGIDMCLHIVRRLNGANLATMTARQMEYEWTGSKPDFLNRCT